MAHYAFLDKDNIVTEVIVGMDENELPEGITSWEEYYGKIKGKKCLRTSYNTSAGIHKFNGIPFRKNYAGVGYTYDETRDAFIPPKPYNSWVLNEDTCLWEPPMPIPGDILEYSWNENTGQWDKLEL